MVRFAAHTAEPALLALRRHVIDTLRTAQEDTGYLGTYRLESRITQVWDVHEQSYLLLALVTDWRLFQEEESLVAAQKLGAYLVEQLSDISLPTQYNEETKSNLALELTMLGLDRALLALFQVTQDRRYLDFCVEKLQLAQWSLPIVQGRHTRIEGHAYAYLTRCLAQLDLQQLTGAGSLTGQIWPALDFLRRQQGLVITGSCSQSECWHSDQDGTGELGETCTTAYLIRLYGRLLGIEGRGVYGDLLERALYNALFAAQSPDGRKLRYYVPFEGKRAYWDRDTYCCPGNFRRIMSELPELIYFTGASELLVNLYTASSATITLDSGLGVAVVQETDYPNSGHVRLVITPASRARFAVLLRLPSWCRQYTVQVNGEALSVTTSQGFLRLDRTWQRGDCVELELAMPWRYVSGSAKQLGRVAVLHGPMVFALNPTRNHLTGQDLQALAVAITTTQASLADETLRPNGISCRVRSAPSGQEILLTEFPDPGNEATYFIPLNMMAAIRDELLLP